jgi:bacillolysin/thermolysin
MKTRTTAKDIPVNTDISAMISSTSDRDYFKFNNSSTQPHIKVTLTNLPADYDLKLYSADGTSDLYLTEQWQCSGVPPI